MSYTSRVSERMYPLAIHYADGRGAGTHTSAYVSLQDYHRAWLVINVGDQEAAATFDASIRQAQDAAGTGVKAITGKSITQLTGDGSDLVCIELQTEELDVDNGFEHVCFRIVIAGGAVIYSAILYGLIGRFKPVPTTNWTEIVG